jgi:hypothetical protein
VTRLTCLDEAWVKQLHHLALARAQFPGSVTALSLLDQHRCLSYTVGLWMNWVALQNPTLRKWRPEVETTKLIPSPACNHPVSMAYLVWHLLILKLGTSVRAARCGFCLIFLYTCERSCIWVLKADIFRSETWEDQMASECWKRPWQLWNSVSFKTDYVCQSRPGKSIKILPEMTSIPVLLVLSCRTVQTGTVRLGGLICFSY